MGNESHFCAYFEKAGMEEDIKSLIFIDIDVGIGAGIILDNQIFEGALGNAGEFGHISVDMNGPVCKCGKRGCLETLASVPAIVRRSSDAAGRDLTFEDIKELYVKKDEVILNVLEDAANRLAYGISNIINMMNPEAVILGGRIPELGEDFLELVRARLKNISLAPDLNRIILKYFKAAGNPVTNGCALFMLDRIFFGNEFFAG
jgi:N-acetylglucosamine repressor